MRDQHRCGADPALGERCACKPDRFERNVYAVFAAVAALYAAVGWIIIRSAP